jgi:hypothetical protein
VDNGFRQIDGGDRGGDPPAPPSDRALLTFRWSRPRPANDNRAPLALRLWRQVFIALLVASLLGLAWTVLALFA